MFTITEIRSRGAQTLGDVEAELFVAHTRRESFGYTGRRRSLPEEGETLAARVEGRSNGIGTSWH